MTNSSLPVSTNNYIPHRESMQLVHHLHKFSRDSAESIEKIRGDNIFLNEKGILGAAALVELIAQLSAAHSGYEAAMDNQAQESGYLVGISGFEISSKIEVNDELRLYIKKEYVFDPVTYLRGIVSKNGETAAEGTIKIWKEKFAAEQEVDPEGFQIDTDRSPLDEQIRSSLKILRNDEQGLQAEIEYKRSFIGFCGHFPEKAVLPGVIMVHTAQLLAEELPGFDHELKQIKQVKFGKLVLPGDLLQIKIKKRENNSQLVIETIFYKEEEECSKLLCLYI